VNPISKAILLVCVQTYTNQLCISPLDVDYISKDKRCSKDAVIKLATEIGVWVLPRFK
jgi:hypothetical protein